MSVAVITRPADRNWSGNPIHYSLYSAEAAGDSSIYFEVKVMAKRTDAVSFTEVVTLPFQPVDGLSKIDIQDILDSILEFELPQVGDNEYSSPTIATKATALFYIEYREITTDDDDPDWIDSEENLERFVIKGGISFEKWRGDNYWVNYFDVVKPWLTWQQSGKLHAATERMYLAWLNLTNVNSLNIAVRRTICYTDLTTESEVFDVAVVKNQIMYFATGGAQQEADWLNAAKALYYWEFEVLDVTVEANPIAISTAFRYYADNRNDYNGLTLNYRNSIAGLDSIRVRGVIEQFLQRTYDNIEKVVAHNYFTGNHIEGRTAAINARELRVYRGDVGHLGKEEQDRIRDIHYQRECWWEKDDKWIPVVVLTESGRLRLTSDKRWTFPIEFAIASNGEYFYTPDSINLQEGNPATGPDCDAIISHPTYELNGSDEVIVNWNLISGAAVQYTIVTAAVSGGAPHTTIATTYNLGELPAGQHLVYVTPQCTDGVDFTNGVTQTLVVNV